MEEPIHQRSMSFTRGAERSNFDEEDDFELPLRNADDFLLDESSELEKPEPFNYKAAIVYALLWYLFSVALSVYNKWMFSPKGLNFAFPVLTTGMHQGMQVILAYITTVLLGINHDFLPLNAYATQVLPCVLASAGDIGMGNLSLQFVTLSFYTMIKSSSLGFVLLFSIIFRLEVASWRLGGIIAILTIGVAMMVQGETNFHLAGFILVLSAACSSGLRWAVTKILLSGHLGNTKPHPVRTIMLLAPGMAIILIVWGLIQEGPREFANAEIWKTHNAFIATVYLLFPGVLAFCMTWSEFELLNATGALTLAIAGVMKEMITILVSVLVFHDTLSIVNLAGLVVSVVAIALYHRYRLALIK